MKKRLSAQQEFEVMKMVLDKFLWLGLIVMIFGLYQMFTATVGDGVFYLLVGAVMLITFTVLIIKEYEVIK